MADSDTRIVITASDRTAAGIASAKAGLEGLKSSFGSLQSVVATLSGLGAVAMFTNWAKDTIAAASALDDLADATGSSVESLSKLANIATVSGASFDTIDAAIKKLAVGMAGVDEESSRAGKALAAIGVQSRDPAQALTEIALKFAEYEDGANKAALAVAIFGKSGADLLPVLKDIAQNVDIAGTVTAQQAKAAEDLEKSYRRLGLAASALKSSLLDDLVPALTASISSFNLARAAGLGFLDSLMMTGNYGPEGIAKAIDEASASVADLRKRIEDPNLSDSFVLKLNAQLETAEKKLKALQAIQASINGPAWDKAYPSRNSSGRQTEAPTIPGGDPAKLKKAADGWKEMADNVKRYYDNIMAGYEADEIIAKNLREQLELIDRLHEANAKSIESIDNTTSGYQKQIDALTLTEDAILSKEQARLQEIVDSRLYEGYINAETEALQRQIAVLQELRGAKGSDSAAKAAKAAADEWQRAADSISNSLTDALMRGFESGKGWAQNFVQTLKNMFGSLVLRPIIQGIVAPVAGGVTSLIGSGGAAASTGPSLGGLGGIFGGGGGLLSGIGDAIFGGGGGAAFGAGFASPLSTLGSIFSGAGEFAAPGMALASGLGAAVPIIGGALAIASMAGLFDSKGGPKSGGFASAGSIGSLTGSDNGRWFTPNGDDDAMRKAVAASLASFNQALASLGGKGNAGFALGFDTDPQGTAPNRLHAGAFVNGQSVYDAALGDLGRDDAALQAALELEAKRSVLAALKASELPQQIAAAFNSVSAAGASSEAIDNLLAYGAAMKSIIDSIGGSVVDDAQTAWERSQRGSVQALSDMGAEVIQLAANMDGSATSMQALSAATATYRQAVVQTLLAIKQISVQVEEMFGATRDSLETFGLDPAALYDRYRKDADAAMSSLLNATDPESVQRLAERINADINKAFGALDDTGKTQHQNPLLEYLTGVNDFVQQKLEALSAGVAEKSESPFTAAKDALDAAAQKFIDAAASQQNAADGQIAASEKISDAADSLDAGMRMFISQLPIGVTVNVRGSEVNA